MWGGQAINKPTVDTRQVVISAMRKSQLTGVNRTVRTEGQVLQGNGDMRGEKSCDYVMEVSRPGNSKCKALGQG